MGTIVPKASVNAIRSGYPFNVTSAPQICSFYVDTRILPGANPMDVADELRGVLSGAGVEGEVELFLYRPGFEARGAERLIETIRRCHDQVVPDAARDRRRSGDQHVARHQRVQRGRDPRDQLRAHASSEPRANEVASRSRTSPTRRCLRSHRDGPLRPGPAENVPLGAHVNRRSPPRIGSRS